MAGDGGYGKARQGLDSRVESCNVRGGGLRILRQT